MSLMSGLYVGQSGLQTSQNALHTVTHNLSNIDTTGYTRQQVVQADRTYINVGESYISKSQTGLGVSYAQVRQVRDYFLDRTYRIENGRASYYEEGYQAAVELDTLFGEMEGVAFQDALSELWVSAEELQKDPANATNQGLFISTCASFLEQAQAVYNGLASYQDILNEKVRDTVDTINDYGHKIHELNQKIKSVETGGREKANDLRDARNQLLDELSSYGYITVEENWDGTVNVQFEHRDFVTPKYVSEMEAKLEPTTGFYDVVWLRDTDLNGDKVQVFDLTREIDSAAYTDVGGLRAILQARGTDRGYYTDIPEKPEVADYQDEDGNWLTATSQADYNAALKAYDEDVVEYNKTVNKSLIQNSMAEFDKLIHGITTEINNLFNPVLKKNSGEKYQAGISVFLRQGTLDPQKSTDPFAPVDDEFDGSDTDGDGEAGTADDLAKWKFAAKESWYTTANLKINPLLLQEYNQLGAQVINPDAANISYTKGFMTADNKENREMADALVDLFADDFDTLNPNLNTPVNYMDFYKSLIGEAANVGYAYNVTAQSQNMTVEVIDDSRQQVLGVSDNEELSNMIMYQNAYNASSRYINAVNELLSHLINTLAT